ncbi:MAG: DNA mismatch repair endonuclease MutL [Bacteriovoracaceae bacterium]
MTLSPPKIDLLPEHLIDQIKAGEVIERPGSLIKEILENSIDAGATRIELHIKNNGLDLISLKDNGHGMTFNDLPLAFSRHATSKIKRFEDLYQLHSFGFRGEALASIAAIARVQCHSYLSSGEGSEIRIEGGQTIYHGKKQVQGNQGTELVIQDLFFNTPARLKFIQTQQAEKQFLKKTIYAFILSHPQIEFIVKFEDDEKEIFHAAQDLKTRIEEIVPKSKGLLLYSEKFYEDNELEVYLIPSFLKLPIKWQYIFINGRYVLDKQLHKVLSNALISSFGEEEYNYLVFFHLPADHIDVNVHPNKTLIKCLETSKMISLLSSTIKELAQGRKPISPVSSTPLPPSDFLSSFQDAPPSLLQQRHDYNMEGLFSPHNIQQEKSDFYWVGNFLMTKYEMNWMAINCSKLLEEFVSNKMNTQSLSIPLLVSEPYPSRGVSKEVILKLQNAGFEIENLGAETLVLRAIPDWMNGFPLRDIVSHLLEEKKLTELKLIPAEWASSTWHEMLTHFKIDVLIEKKIIAELEALLKDRLK